MNAKVSISHPQFPSSLTTTSKAGLLTEKAESLEPFGSENFDAQHLSVQANKMTDVLKNILEHSCYTHGGLNE